MLGVLLISLLCLIFATCINLNWIHDIACYLGYPLAGYLVLFVALISGFMYLFTLLSLLFRKKKRNGENTECNVTV